LSDYDAGVISATAAAYFDEAMAFEPHPDPKLAANLLTKVALRQRSRMLDVFDMRPAAQLAIASNMRAAGELSSQNAEEVYARHLATGESVQSIVEELGLRQISDSSELEAVVQRVLDANPRAVADVRAGKPQAIKFLVGQVMRETRGQAKADAVQQLIEGRLA
jgi:aspartyl-tRNA(Asn)/glutamyl-tRNA(Gln) amidotransferase subunit B